MIGPTAARFLWRAAISTVVYWQLKQSFSEENILEGREIMKITIRALLFAAALAVAAPGVPLPTPTPEPPIQFQATTLFGVPLPSPTPEPPAKFQAV
jgi:hypothetical protein